MVGYSGSHMASWICWIGLGRSVWARPSSAAAVATAAPTAADTVRKLRLRTPSPGLLGLPWEVPLAEWMMPDVALRDIAVGHSRHTVRFVDADNQLWALKDLPADIANKEDQVLRRLEDLGLPAVRPAGLVLQLDIDTSILITLSRGIVAVPPTADAAAARPAHPSGAPVDAMATLLVELHRHGVFWGDCSLANTLFSRIAFG
jgi:hypothetical protein